MLDFGLFAVKSMKFSLTRFSNIQVYIIEHYALKWCFNIITMDDYR